MPTPHVLLGWELGANRGHVTSIGAIARALARRGARVTFAVQRLDAMRALRPLDDSWAFLQAPAWPGLLVNAGFGGPQPTATFGDILAILGLRDSGVVEFLVRGWDGLLNATRPDAVIADFAPMLQLAARGRIPVVATGTGFSLPPDHLEAYPPLWNARPTFPEPELLKTVNVALERCGRPPLVRLPEIMAAERRMPHSLALFDPYGDTRRDRMLAPILPNWSAAHVADGDEIFVYFSETAHRAERIYDALARFGSRVRIHVPNLAGIYLEKLRAAGVVFEPRPQKVIDIARRSGLVVSHGGLGLVSMTLAAGLPQLVLAPDLEKRLIGETVTRLGVGKLLRWSDVTADSIAANIEELCADVNVRQRASQLGRTLAPLLAEDAAEAIAESVLSLCT
jgi:rhamnosyltransferase subunit B